MADKTKTTGCALPISRIKTIMKSSPEVSVISQESLFLIAKATEIFIKDLAEMTLKKSKDPKNVEYSVLADIVNTDETMQFLQDIIPRKITVKEFYEMTGRKMPGASGDADGKLDDDDVQEIDSS